MWLNKRKVAFLLTLIMTVATVVLRTVHVPMMQSVDTGVFHFSYAIMAVMLLTVIAVAVLLFASRREISTMPLIKGAWALPIALLTALAGVLFLVCTVLDMYNWAANGVAPAPSTGVIGTADRITLFLSLIFGAFTGVYFIRLGLNFLHYGKEVRGLMPLLGLCPTLWMWMRLARYEMSYASAVEVHESFFDFAMLLMTLLFLFALARHFTGIESKKPWCTITLGLGTALMSISGPVTRLVFYLLGEGEAFRSGQMAGVLDVTVGILALALSLYWTFAPTQKVAQSTAADAVTPEIEEMINTELDKVLSAEEHKDVRADITETE